MKKLQFILFFLIFSSALIFSQNNIENHSQIIKPRARIIIDNDFGGDPDGLFQLAHHLLSPSVEIRAIIGSQHYRGGFYGLPGNSEFACSRAVELLDAMKLSAKYKVYQGADSALMDIKNPVLSAGAKAIVEEAMRKDTDLPLYVVCGAGLTDIASAYLMQPEIADKIKLIWIGGPEYNGLGIAAPPGTPILEYNLGIDVKAAQVIFNNSKIPIWQIPRNVYRQALYSYSELAYKVKSKGSTGLFLMEKLDDLLKRANGSLGEAYVLGDSPLVLLTALQSGWEADPSSCKYVTKNCPLINDSGLYEENAEGRKIRVYTDIDARLMIDDFVAKLALYNKK